MVPEQSTYSEHKPNMFFCSPPLSPPLSESEYVEQSETTDQPLAYNVYQRILGVAERDDKTQIDEEFKRKMLIAAFLGPSLYYQH